MVPSNGRTDSLAGEREGEDARAHLHVEPPLGLVALVVVDLEEVDGLDALDEALLGRRGRREDDRDEGKDAGRVKAGDGEGRVRQGGLSRVRTVSKEVVTTRRGRERGRGGGGGERGEDARERGGR